MTAGLNLQVLIHGRRCTKCVSLKCQSCKALKKFNFKHLSIPTEANGGHLSQQHYCVLKWQINEDTSLGKVGGRHLFKHYASETYLIKMSHRAA